MRENVMQLPSVVRQIGKITGDERVYIEDYVYSYLKKLKNADDSLPVRAAVYGRTFRKNHIRFYFIYGASCEREELENGMTQEQIARKYFPDYRLIGYVNLYSKENLQGEGEGCYVFYETNEAMQDYLLYCRERLSETEPYVKKRRKASRKVEKMRQEQDFFVLMKEALQKLIMGILVLAAAVAANSINHYDRMCEFTVMAVKAVQEVP